MVVYGKTDFEAHKNEDLSSKNNIGTFPVNLLLSRWITFLFCVFLSLAFNVS